MPRLPWPAERRPIWRRAISLLKFLCTAALLALMVAVMTGFFVQRISAKRDAIAYPPVGQLIDTGEARLHARVMGDGDITVVFDSGLGGTSLDWSLVAPEVAKHARVVLYDRAGMGWSGPGKAPRDAARVAEELHGLLEALGVTGPRILVGHSLAGYHIRMYQARYPDEVAGMVFVDCSHEDQWERLPNDNELLLRAYPWILRGLGCLAEVGGTRPKLWFIGDDPGDKTDKHDQEMKRNFFTRPQQFYASAGEYEAIPESCRQLKGSRKPLGDLPLVVLTGMEDKGKDMGKVWLELQTDLASMSTRSRHQVIEDAGHYVQSERPDAVIAAVLEVIEQARGPHDPAWSPASPGQGWSPESPYPVLRVESIWGA